MSPHRHKTNNFLQGTAWHVDRNQDAAAKVFTLITKFKKSHSDVSSLNKNKKSNLEVSSLKNWTILEGVRWGQFPKYQPSKREMLKEICFFLSPEQPASTSPRSRTQQWTGKTEGGSRGSWRPLQRAWTSGKTPPIGILVVSVGECFIYKQVGHKTTSKWRTVGREHQRLLQWPGQKKLHYLVASWPKI